MVFYLVGAAIEILACILTLCTDIVYTEDWEFGKISGIGSVHTEGNYHSYSMIELYGWMAIILLSIVLIVCVIYAVCYMTGNKRLIPQFVIFIVYLIPLGLMIAAISELNTTFEAIKNDIASYGSGTSAGMTGMGIFTMALMIIGTIVTLVSLFIHSKNDEKTDQVVQRKNNDNKNVSKDDFNF